MTLSKGHFEFVIGSLTFDLYKQLESGVAYVLDCSQGFHKSTIHLASRYPIQVSEYGNPFIIFPIKLWISIFFALLVFVFVILNIWALYKQINRNLVKSNLEISQIVIRVSIGFTEPDNEGWFRGYSTGRMIMSLWFIASFFLISFYAMDLRAEIIAPDFEKPIETINDIDFATTKIMINYGN